MVRIDRVLRDLKGKDISDGEEGEPDDPDVRGLAKRMFKIPRDKEPQMRYEDLAQLIDEEAVSAAWPSG